MKRARIINKKQAGSDNADENHGASSPINKEITKAKPVKFSNEGITVFQRNTRATDEGLEAEVRKPVLFDGRGRHINSDSDLQGECSVCKKLVSLIFYCSIQGCKRLLCEEHVFIFNDGESDSHYCRQHYDEVIMNYDTWHLREKRVSDEKHLRKD